MPNLIDTTTGETVWIAESQVADALASERFVAPEGATRTVRTTAGTRHAVPAGATSTPGMRPEAPEERAAEARDVVRDEEFGGPGQAVLTGVEGVARGASLHLTDALGLTSGERAKVRREYRPHLATATELAGAVAPAIVTGGASAAPGAARGIGSRALAATPAGAAARAGRAVGGTKGLVLEGTAHGAGGAAGALALSEDPVTLERAVGEIGSGVLLGGGLLGGVSLAGKALGKGIQRARGAVDDAVARRATPGGGVVDEIAEYSTARDTSGVIGQIAKGENKAVLAKGRSTLRDALDAPETLAKSPTRLRAVLEKDTKVLRELVEEGEEKALQRLAARDREVFAAVRKRLDDAAEAGKTQVRLPKDLAAEYRAIRGMQGRGGMKVSTDDAQTFLGQLGGPEVMAARREVIAQLPALLEQNLAVRAAVEAAAAGPKVGMLENLARQNLASGIVGFAAGGPLGVPIAMAAPKIAAKIADLVTGRMSKAAGAAATRSTEAVDALMRVGGAAGKAAPVAATKLLSSVSFGPTPKVTPIKGASKLTESYRQRAAELRSQTVPGPQGVPQMKPAARRQVAERLRGVAAVDPVLADRIESVVARRVEYLASKLPRKPDTAAIQVGPDRWRPSEFAMRAFARHVAAVEDPGSVEERLADGSITPEDAEAYRTVYPERYERMKRDIIERLPELQETLPYHRRLALSVFFGVPVDPALEPRVLATLQGNFSQEVGTDAGTHAPAAQPQFGSVTNPEPTPAQERAQG